MFHGLGASRAQVVKLSDCLFFCAIVIEYVKVKSLIRFKIVADPVLLAGCKLRAGLHKQLDLPVCLILRNGSDLQACGRISIGEVRIISRIRPDVNGSPRGERIGHEVVAGSLSQFLDINVADSHSVSGSCTAQGELDDQRSVFLLRRFKDHRLCL